MQCNSNALLSKVGLDVVTVKLYNIYFENNITFPYSTYIYWGVLFKNAIHAIVLLGAWVGSIKCVMQ